MNGSKAIRLSWNGPFAAIVALGVLGTLFSAGNARAACGTPAKAGAISHFPALAPISLTQGGNHSQAPATIVGLWHVVYTATYTTSGPLGVPMLNPGESFEFSQTLKTWHADGTEWEEKILPPRADDYCFGVWKHNGDDSVKLHHIGVIVAPDGTIENIFYIDEIDRVAPDGNTYNGTWDMKLYDPTDVMGTGDVLQEIKGTTAAERIKVD